MTNWNDATIPLAERERLVLKWAARKGIPYNKALNIAKKKLQTTANNTYLNEWLDRIEEEISDINTDDYTQELNLYDENNGIKERLYILTNELREYLEG